MMSHCAKCGEPLEGPDTYEFAGQSWCEDCYLEQRIKPVACDPWAVYGARKTSGKTRQLTDVQEEILKLLKAQGPLPASTICARLKLTATQFESNFATLRHMELARGVKDGDEIYHTEF